MPKVIIITGPPASGKTTITKKLAELTKHSVVINVDDLRDMIKSGKVKPWEQKRKAKEQILLAAKNACDLAKNFLKSRFDVFIDDVIISDELINFYKKHLGKKLKIYLLLPSKKVLTERDKTRLPDEVMGKRTIELHDKFTLNKNKANFQIIDNSNLTVEETAKEILKSTHRLKKNQPKE